MPTNVMLSVILFQPEIPPNTGNIIRLCANTGASLHLIHPLGFQLTDRQLRRAGLDYHEWAQVHDYPSLQNCLETLCPARLLALTTKGQRGYQAMTYQSDDALLFGAETRGLPSAVLQVIPEAQRLRIPMLPTSRSLNLSNAVAIVVYEAWRQLGFPAAQ